ncbi:MAG TPA: hypothetical protein DDW50_08680 [Firmicutes bacterium]|jgi:predicted metal-binding protein|nr:hypothetical protein [Bacillota bacterium]
MLETLFEVQTPSSKIKIQVIGNIIASQELIKFLDKEKFSELCKSGCPTYDKKWACPPYSPSYDQYAKLYSKAMLVCFFCTMDQFGYIKNDYLKIKAANSILKSRMDKFMRNLETELGGEFLSNGSCRICKPCSCKNKEGGCKNPTKRRYSMEAVGLDVGKISEDILEHKLFWYGKNRLPLYTSVVSCLLNNNQRMNLEGIKKISLLSS